MNNRNIVYIGGFMLPDKNAAAHRVMANGSIMSQLGYKVTFLDIDGNYAGIFREFEKYNILSRGKYNGIVQKITLLFSIRELKKIFSILEDIDMVICYNMPSIAFFRILNYCHKRHVKIISDCTEWYENTSLLKFLDTFVRMHYLNKKTDGLICISRFLSEFYKEQVKIIVPPLISNNTKYQPKTEKSDSVAKLCYIGNPGKHKDKINIVIKALNQLPDTILYKFEIIGLTKDQYLSMYPKDSPLVENVDIIFHGRLSHDESIDVLRKSDYQIFLREDKRVNNAGFPTKFVESISLGVPVITTRTSDLPFYIVDGVNSFFVSIINFRDDLIKILNNIKISNEELLKLKSQFDEEKYVSVFLNFFEEILKYESK